MIPNATQHHQQAIAAYQNSHHSGLSTREAMAELLARIIRQIQEAKHCYCRRQLDTMCFYNAKTLQLILHLSTALDVDESAPDAAEARIAHRYHQEVYADTFLRLTNVVLSGSVENEFDAIIGKFRELYKAWSIGPATIE
jgi:flagellin-specific chaperone FliS